MLRSFAVSKPVLAFSLIALPVSWVILTALVRSGAPVEIGVIALTFIILIGLSTLITYWKDGKAGFKKLFGGIIKWRVHWGYYLFALLAMPLGTIMLSLVTGTFSMSDGGIGAIVSTYAVSLVTGFLIINLWEETGWAGFVQTQLMKQKGLLVGSLLTAPLFAGIHIPLAFQSSQVSEIVTTLAVLFGLALFFRYLIGMVLLDTKGSILIVGLLHAAFNSSNGLGANKTDIESIVVLILLTIGYFVFRRLNKKLDR